MLQSWTCWGMLMFMYESTRRRAHTFGAPKKKRASQTVRLDWAALHCVSEWQQHAPIIWAILSLYYITLLHPWSGGMHPRALMQLCCAWRERAARQTNEKRFSLASDWRENHRLRNMLICRNVCELGMEPILRYQY